jgi:hypothetical protein
VDDRVVGSCGDAPFGVVVRHHEGLFATDVPSRVIAEITREIHLYVFVGTLFGATG